MSEKAQRVKAVTEAVGLAAVLLGLVFVGVELRGNTEAVKAATFQSLTDISNDYVMQIAADPELARILHTARASGLAALAPSDSARYWSMERAFWVRMQNVFSQYSRGTLTDEDFHMYREVICGSTGGTRDMWPEHRGILSAALVTFVEDCWSQ
jgi:hypothetical protein